MDEVEDEEDEDEESDDESDDEFDDDYVVSEGLRHPMVQSHTYEHQYFRNLIMYMFVGGVLINCSFLGYFFSYFYDIQGWYWDCLDNARTNLTLI